MTIALISCGPSAIGFSESDHEGPVICVSRAATMFRCDFWSCFDLPEALRLTDSILGNPRLFTIHDTLGSLHRRGNKWADVAIEAETLSRPCPCPIDRWMLFTAPAALVLAASMGASRVDCYGVDMAGTDDVTGDPGCDRSEARWVKERKIWDEVVEWVRGMKVEVTRTTASDSARGIRC